MPYHLKLVAVQNILSYLYWLLVLFALIISRQFQYENFNLAWMHQKPIIKMKMKEEITTLFCYHLRNKVYKFFCSLPCFLFSISRDGQRTNMKREKRMLQLEQTVQVSSCSKIKDLICHWNSSLGVDNKLFSTQVLVGAFYSGRQTLTLLITKNTLFSHPHNHLHLTSLFDWRDTNPVFSSVKEKAHTLM